MVQLPEEREARVSAGVRRVEQICQGARANLTLVLASAIKGLEEFKLARGWRVTTSGRIGGCHCRAWRCRGGLNVTRKPLAQSQALLKLLARLNILVQL